MAARSAKATETVEVDHMEQLRQNMAILANELCEKVRGKEVDTAVGVDKIVAIYNAIKQV